MTKQLYHLPTIYKLGANLFSAQWFNQNMILVELFFIDNSSFCKFSLVLRIIEWISEI